MKRIAIYVFYDEEGTIDDYKMFLLESIRPYISELLIVVNGYVQQNELYKLKNVTDKIFFRENQGLDGEAYREILLGKFGCFDWNIWDEIILFNNSFLGPFLTWDEIFDMMEKDDNDFWGFSRHLGGWWRNSKGDTTRFPEHIQSYFLAIRKSMFSSSSWIEYWKNMKTIHTYKEAIEYFEQTFTVFFKDKGFRCNTWLDIYDRGRYVEYGIEPLGMYGYEIVRDYKFPIMKRQCMSIFNWEKTKKILEYIEQNTNYPKELIIKYMDNKGKPYKLSKIQKFVKMHDRIYIFGHGVYGKKLEAYFIEEKIELSGFVVSAPKNEDEIGIDDLVLEKNDGIIVALGKSNLEEVKEILESKYLKEQLLWPE